MYDSPNEKHISRPVLNKISWRACEGWSSQSLHSFSKLTASRCTEEYDLNSASAIFNLVPECLCSYKCKVSLIPLFMATGFWVA